MDLGRDDEEDGGSEREEDADISIMREDRETDIIIMAFIRIFPFSQKGDHIHRYGNPETNFKPAASSCHSLMSLFLTVYPICLLQIRNSLLYRLDSVCL
jgi:hypothetical protein